MKFNSAELVAWFNHRVYPMVAFVITHFVVGGILVAAFGLAGPDSGLSLFIISIAMALTTVLFIVSTVADMKLLSMDASDEFKSTQLGASMKGFEVFAVLFSVLVLAVPVAHGLLFL
ncbi:MAG: hypothetical protein ACO3S8_05900 [Aquiluna sp.]